MISPGRATGGRPAGVAASVKFGQAKAIVFPFRLSGAVPAGWHPVSATYKPAQGPWQSDSDATACTQGPDHGLYLFVDPKLDTTGAPPGGISAVLTHLSVLGVDPASWTATPLAG